MDKFTKDLNSPEVADIVREVKNAGDKAGVKGTPAFYIDGKPIDAPQSADQLRETIDKALKAAKTN